MLCKIVFREIPLSASAYDIKKISKNIILLKECFFNTFLTTSIKNRIKGVFEKTIYFRMRTCKLYKNMLQYKKNETQMQTYAERTMNYESSCLR